MECRLANESDDANGSREVSQGIEDNELSDNLDHATSNDTSQASTKPNANQTEPLTKNEFANEATSMLYRLIAAVLSGTRKASKFQIFYALIYLFVS